MAAKNSGKTAAGKSHGRTAGRHNRTDGPSIHELMKVLQIALGKKAAAKLAIITGDSQSACEKWFSGKRELGGASLLEILRSELGREALKFIVAGCAADWARDYRRTQQIIAARLHLDQASKRLAALETGESS